MGFILLAGFLVGLFMALWVYEDAGKRGVDQGSAVIWSVAVFTLMCLFLPIYLITRPPLKTP